MHSAFLKRVSFDTFDNKDASDFSLTLKSKHRDYSYSRRSRTFLCGTDQNDYSEFAPEWLIDELVDDGDEIVCLRVVDKDSKISSDAALQERLYRKEARKLLDQIIDKNEDEKAISIILEFAVGKVHETIQRMVRTPLPTPLLPANICLSADTHIRARHPHCRHPRPLARRSAGPAARVRVQVLPAALARARHRRPTVVQARQEEGQAPR